MTEVSPIGALPQDVGGDALRERLLQAAAAVFARQGYDGTRIIDVVRESGLSTGAVYGRFGSKNELLREAIVSRSRAGVGTGLEGVDRVAELIARVANRTSDPLSDAEALRLEAYVTARREPEVADALADANQAWRESLAPVVELAVEDGTVADDVDPGAVLFLVRILSLGLLLHRGSGLAGPDEQSWRALVDRLVASFGAPSSGGPPSAAAGATEPPGPEDAATQSSDPDREDP